MTNEQMDDVQQAPNLHSRAPTPPPKPSKTQAEVHESSLDIGSNEQNNLRSGTTSEQEGYEQRGSLEVE